ncbi:MAG: hypothetical protein FH749_05635 [Firmicutes bacterium]|nr:hypothetical protein [Bacillota bacterium]
MIRVACVQQKVKIHPTEASFAADVDKFIAQAKKENCRLIAFPEGCGAMLVTQFMAKPLVKTLAAAYSETEPEAKVGKFGKKILAASLDKLTALQDMPKIFKNEVRKNGPQLLESYKRVFASAAAKYELYVVAGSCYAPDPETGEIVNAAYVFGPDGSCLGHQNKIHLYIEDTHICEPGHEIRTFDTEFGPIGVVICYEGMFPEISRVLALKGAKVLINVSACPGRLCWSKIRAGAWSRCQDNQTFGIHSCLVGKNDISKQFTKDYSGPSSILAPLDLTADYSGVLAQTPPDEESIIFADWDFAALDKVRSESDTKVFQEMRPDVYRKYIPGCYDNLD